MKVFLSHKGVNKPLIREFKETLQLLGFEAWLDEDAMSAGVLLERGMLQGFKDSSAVIFFITPDFVDENYLSTEINYAIAEKREKKDKFSIITLVFKKEGIKSTVPELLKPYVYKEPKGDLEALREILKVLLKYQNEQQGTVSALRFELESNLVFLENIFDTLNFLREEAWVNLKNKGYLSYLRKPIPNKIMRVYDQLYGLNECIHVLKESKQEANINSINIKAKNLKSQLTESIKELITLLELDAAHPKIGDNF